MDQTENPNDKQQANYAASGKEGNKNWR